MRETEALAKKKKEKKKGGSCGVDVGYVLRFPSTVRVRFYLFFIYFLFFVKLVTRMKKKKRAE